MLSIFKVKISNICIFFIIIFEIKTLKCQELKYRNTSCYTNHRFPGKITVKSSFIITSLIKPIKYL